MPSTNSTNLDRYSGFFILKNSLLRLTQAQVLQYDVDFVHASRFAEVMLNYAETANETGRPAEALDILKQIRQRAGIEPGADGNYGINAADRDALREAILAERNIELCFEGPPLLGPAPPAHAGPPGQYHQIRRGSHSYQYRTAATCRWT